jgi:hypothetical protein
MAISGIVKINSGYIVGGGKQELCNIEESGDPNLLCRPAVAVILVKQCLSNLY